MGLGLGPAHPILRPIPTHVHMQPQPVTLAHVCDCLQGVTHIQTLPRSWSKFRASRSNRPLAVGEDGPQLPPQAWQRSLSLSGRHQAIWVSRRVLVPEPPWPWADYFGTGVRVLVGVKVIPKTS